MLPLFSLQDVLVRLVAVLVILSVKGYIQVWVARGLGDSGPQQDGRLALNPAQHIGFFSLIDFLLFSIGWVKPLNLDIQRLGPRGMVGVALSGPLACILLAFLIGLLRPLVAGSISSGNVGFALAVFFDTCISLSLWCALINIIPLYPLDGFTAVAGFIPGWWSKVQKYLIYFEVGLLLLGFSRLPLNLLEPLHQTLRRAIGT